MKTIGVLKGVEFLKRCNQIRHGVSDFFEKTKILDKRKILPLFTGEETEEQKQRKIAEQGKKNVSAMLDIALEECPEYTLELLKLLAVPDEGETFDDMDGMDIFALATDILTDKKVMDFLLSLAKLAG